MSQTAEQKEGAVYVFDIPEALWMTSNRTPLHLNAKASRVKALVELGIVKGRCWPRKSFKERVRIDVVIHPRTNVRFDPLNVEPTIKPLLDGLVRAGVVKDDDWRHVTGPFPHSGQPIRTLPHGTHRLVFTFSPLNEETE